jgi:Holliday junction resolvase RusA-like endonuclease
MSVFTKETLMYLFEIHQKPIPQKQTQWGRGKGYDPSKKDKETLIWQIRAYAPIKPIEGPVLVDIMFYMPIPKTSKIQARNMANGAILPIKRPDVDNLAYLITNAMKGIFYEDDSQIVDLLLHKRYGEQTKTVVKVIEL